jgi:predicted O-methyltransferase YrrM
MMDDPLTGLRTRHLARVCRRDQTAISLAAARSLWGLLTTWAPRAVLELGSGFSSSVIRLWQQGQGPRRPVTVYTTDDNWRWLGETLYELEQEHLDTSHVLHQDVFARIVPRQFDVLFLDLADTGTRLALAPTLPRWLKSQGLLILDDWHMEHYREPMTAALVDHGLTVTPIPASEDEYGRYLATATRAGLHTLLHNG